MQQHATAVILAGGRGTRIRDLYPDLPKTMIPACGRPFVEWVIQGLAREGVRRFVISLGHLADVAEAYFAERAPDELHIETVREPRPLGTGGALLFALAEAEEGESDPIVLTNGDSLIAGQYHDAWRLLERDETDGVVLAVEVEDASRFGRLEVDASGRLTGFLEKQPGRGLVNAGVYLFKRRLLRKFPRQAPLSMETEVFPALLAAGARLDVHVCRAPFLDIGTPETVRQVEAFLGQFLDEKVKA